MWSGQVRSEIGDVCKIFTTDQVDGDSNDEYHDVVFVQEKAVHKHGSNAQAARLFG